MWQTEKKYEISNDKALFVTHFMFHVFRMCLSPFLIKRQWTLSTQFVIATFCLCFSCVFLYEPLNRWEMLFKTEKWSKILLPKPKGVFKNGIINSWQHKIPWNKLQQFWMHSTSAKTTTLNVWSWCPTTMKSSETKTHHRWQIRTICSTHCSDTFSVIRSGIMKWFFFHFSFIIAFAAFERVLLAWMSPAKWRRKKPSVKKSSCTLFGD